VEVVAELLAERAQAAHRLERQVKERTAELWRQRDQFRRVSAGAVGISRARARVDLR
jgi:hypothetical protein